MQKKKFHTKKKGNGYAIGHVDQRWALGNRSYLMPKVWDNDDIWVAKNEIFYTAANSSQMRGRTFLTQKGMKYMGSHWLMMTIEKNFVACFQIFNYSNYIVGWKLTMMLFLTKMN